MHLSVIFRSSNENSTDKEIFMYDIATQTVNKLNGELSAAFVDAAEANAEEEKSTNDEDSSSNALESRVPYPDTAEDRIDTDVDQSGSASDFIETNVPVADPIEADLETEASEQLESFVDISGTPIHPREDLTSGDQISISSGYSKTDHN